MSAAVLIIDDDRELCALLSDFLQREDFCINAVHDGIEAVSHCRVNPYDAIVLDIMLPGLQGLDVLRQLRKFSDTPVLMLTARGEDTDRILGLELGADDYLPKPCNPRELAARLRAILRRSPGLTGDERKQVLQSGQTRINPADRSACHAGQDLELTSAEFNVLEVLLKRAGNVVDKETLSQEALGRPLSAYDRSIDVHVSKIRKKMAVHGQDTRIVSIRGIGYQFTVSAQESGT